MTRRTLLVLLVASQLILAVLAGLLVADLYESRSDFNVFNRRWNGYSTLYSLRKDAVPVTLGFTGTVERYLDMYGGDVTILLPVYTKYSRDEIAVLRRALSMGARLIILGEHGAHTNELLEGLGLGIRVYGSGALMDPINNYRDPGIVYVFGNPAVFPNRTLVLNYGTAIRELGNASPWFYSSSLSYIDSDLSGGWDPGEPTGPFPVVAYQRLPGGGEVILVTDASLFVNEMMELGNNTWFAGYIIKAHRVLLIDQTHIGYSSRDYYLYLVAAFYAYINPLVAKGALAAAYAALTWLVVANRRLLAGGEAG